jgi:hypothetical protein
VRVLAVRPPGEVNEPATRTPFTVTGPAALKEAEIEALVIAADEVSKIYTHKHKETNLERPLTDSRK